jgi:phenylalanyl-tRNA synthetase alpha subunit
LKPIITTFEALNFPPNHPARDTQDTLVHRRAGIEAAARSSAAAHAYFASADPHDAEDEAAGACGVSGESSSQRRAGCDALAYFSSGRRAGGRYQHYVLRLEGHARPRHEGALRIEREDALLSVILSVYRTERRRADQLHFLRMARAYATALRAATARPAGWIELLGCGMVDPNVYGFVDYDAAKVSGFAFGMGVERIAILKYGVDDIQLFLSGRRAVFGAVWVSGAVWSAVLRASRSFDSEFRCPPNSRRGRRRYTHRNDE